MIQLPKLDDHQTWADAERDPRVNEESREALHGFGAMFGQGWRGWAASVPLTLQFFTAIENGSCEGVRLWQMVKALDGVPGSVGFARNALGSRVWREYVAAVMALELCSRVRAGGGDAEFIQRDQETSPDTRLRLAERWITVELKALHDPDELEPWGRFRTKSSGRSCLGAATARRPSRSPNLGIRV